MCVCVCICACIHARVCVCPCVHACVCVHIRTYVQLQNTCFIYPIPLVVFLIEHTSLIGFRIHLILTRHATLSFSACFVVNWMNGCVMPGYHFIECTSSCVMFTYLSTTY